MGRFLAISSQVASGHVGLSAIVPALNALGHEVIALPTIVLSNHPGHPRCDGFRTDPAVLRRMLQALEENGRLVGIDTILSGYLPSQEHVAFVREAVERVKIQSADAYYICDPVIGDDPKGLYIDEAAALAIRDELMPIADLIVPNRFELAWLSGEKVQSVETAARAAGTQGVTQVLATSIPHSEADENDSLANTLVTHDHVQTCITPRYTDVPHGTGDLFTGLYAAEPDLGSATSRLAHVVKRSLGQPELALIEAMTDWDAAEQLPVRLQSDGPDANQAGTEPVWVAGVDGCPGGWAVVSHPLGAPLQANLRICESFAEILEIEPRLQFIAVDMPIGLPDQAIRGGRQADIEARAVLGERQSSVFAVPARAAVICRDYREACDVALSRSDPPRKISKQAFMLFPKIREIDNLMSPELQKRIFEVHPEVAFWALNGKRPLELPKKIKSRPFAEGLELRKKLLAAAGYDISRIGAVDYPRKVVGEDDIIDAFAAAWSAARIARGEAHRFPTSPKTDAKGLRMEICY